MSIRSSAGKIASTLVLIGVAAAPSLLVPLSTAVAEVSTTYKDPETGLDCVNDVSTEQVYGDSVRIRYHNSCGRSFMIHFAPNSRSEAKYATGISAYGDATLTPNKSEMPGSWWFD